MNFASLNFTMDVLLILVALGFLIRDYPVRTACLTLLCIFSYIVPIARIEDGLNPPMRHKIPAAIVAQTTTAAKETSTQTSSTATTDSSTDADNPDAPANQAAAESTPATPAEAVSAQVQQMAQADPTQINRNVTGVWNTVLNGLNNAPGANNDAPTNVDQAVSDQASQAIAAVTGSSLGHSRFEWTNLQNTLLEGRFGHTVLREKEIAMVDAFWFIARCCLLAGGAYFLLSDWKVTMSIVSFCVIPLHYYLVLVFYFGRNWEKTKPWWGLIQGIGITLIVLVLIAITIRQIMSMVGRHHYEIPNPEHYRARMGGIDYDYVLLDNVIQLAGISLDLGVSYFDKNNPKILRFQSGAAIEFIARATQSEPAV